MNPNDPTILKQLLDLCEFDTGDIYHLDHEIYCKCDDSVLFFILDYLYNDVEIYTTKPKHYDWTLNRWNPCRPTRDEDYLCESNEYYDINDIYDFLNLLEGGNIQLKDYDYREYKLKLLTIKRDNIKITTKQMMLDKINDLEF